MGGRGWWSYSRVLYFRLEENCHDGDGWRVSLKRGRISSSSSSFHTEWALEAGEDIAENAEETNAAAGPEETLILKHILSVSIV